MRIYRYPLTSMLKQTFQLPLVKVLDIQMQGDGAVLWALIDESKPVVNLEIYFLTTGEGFDKHYYDNLQYIATLQYKSYVTHWFYREV